MKLRGATRRERMGYELEKLASGWNIGIRALIYVAEITTIVQKLRVVSRFRKAN